MFTAAQIAAMDDRDMALHASGSYGPKLRNDFLASVRKVAEKADAKESILTLRPRSPFANSQAAIDYNARATLAHGEPQDVA